MEQWWNGTDRGNVKVLEKNLIPSTACVVDELIWSICLFSDRHKTHKCTLNAERGFAEC